MTHYQRISPVYEAVKYEKGMEDGFLPCTDIPYFRARGEKIALFQNSVVLTNTGTGERSVVSQEEFEREFREVESHD